MPNALIQKYAAQAKCSVSHAEQEWERAKGIAREKLKIGDGPKYWAYVNGITRKALKLKESFKDFAEDVTMQLEMPPAVQTVDAMPPAEVDHAPDTPNLAAPPPEAVPTAEPKQGGCSKLVSTLFGARDWAHTLHLRTASHAEHLALEDLYNELVTLTDRYAETSQGKHGLLNVLADQSMFVGTDPKAFAAKLAGWLEGEGRQCLDQSDSYLLNQVDEITAAVYLAKYKLDNLH